VSAQKPSLLSNSGNQIQSSYFKLETYKNTLVSNFHIFQTRQYFFPILEIAYVAKGTSCSPAKDCGSAEPGSAHWQESFSAEDSHPAHALRQCLIQRPKLVLRLADAGVPFRIQEDRPMAGEFAVNEIDHKVRDV
jgi:hypothetical protein